MKIAIVSCVFPPYRGGISEAAYNFAASLNTYKNSVSVLTPDYGNENELDCNCAFKIVKLKPLIKFGKAAFIPGLLKELNNYDIVQLHYPFFGGAELVWLSFFFRKKYKLFVHYHMDTRNLPFAKRLLSVPSALIRNSLFLRALKITCASLDYIKTSQIKKIYKKYPSKFEEIPFGVDTDKFIADESRKNRGKKYKIIFIAALDRAHYFKGLDLLFEAISKLKYDYDLAIIGEGDLKESYKNKAKQLGIRQKVNFLGRVSDLDKIKNLQSSDLLVLPSINSHEAFGLVLIEAMACGCAVLASDLPGVRHVFNDSEHGFLFKTKDKEDLIKKLNRALADKEILAKMGKAAGQYAKEKYSLKAMGEKLNSLFNSQHGDMI